MPLPIDDIRLRYELFPPRHLLSFHFVFAREEEHTTWRDVSFLDDFVVKRSESVMQNNKQGEKKRQATKSLGGSAKE